MEPRKESDDPYIGVWIVGAFIFLIFLTIVDYERTLPAWIVMGAIFIGGLFYVWRNSKKIQNPTLHCSTCGQELPEDQSSALAEKNHAES